MKALLALTATLCCSGTSAQYWRAMGRGLIGSVPSIQTLYGDSVSNRLLAGGTFLHIMNESDTVLGCGQAAWNGLRWDSLANRIQPYNTGGELVQQTFWFLRFQGQLYACGGFQFLAPDGNWNFYMARLNEATEIWETLGCTIPYTSGILTLVPKIPDTTLYATGFQGYDSTFCGFPAQCVFRYDGSAFHPWEPFGQIPPNVNNYVGTVFDYKGKTYMTCSVPDPVDGEGYVSFIRWNGTSWEHVPGWNTLSPIKEILIHGDTLYVAGAFHDYTDGPGNLVAAFDGENWDDMGGGLHYLPVPMSGVAWDLKWFHGALWVCGLFDRAGDIPAHSIAHWDGHQWCVPPGDIRWKNNANPVLTDMGIWRDSLYICGGINTIDGDTIRQVAQWIGGDAVEACSTVGIAEATPHSPALDVTPLAEPGRWRVQFPDNGDWTLHAFDVMGRAVGSWQASGTTLEVDLSAQSQGLYLLVATAPDGSRYGTKVVRQ